jgi:two-component system, OmpR family, phosphate regulon sensor histidine kinase PhoR
MLLMKKINVLIGTMLLAIFFLVAFQWYWIQNAISVKRDQFDRKVIETLNETVKEIEKQEVIYLAKQKLEDNKKLRLVEISKTPKRQKRQALDNLEITEKYQKTDSLHHSVGLMPEHPEVVTMHENNGFTIKKDAFSNRILIIPPSESSYIKDFLEEEYVSYVQFKRTQVDRSKKQKNINNIIQLINNESDNNYPEEQENFVQDYENTNNEYSIIYNKPKNLVIENIQNKDITLKKDPQKSKNQTKKIEKTNIVKNIFSDLMLGKRSIYERMGNLMLDTLLKEKFKNNGITLPFEYGVRDNGLVVFASLKPGHPQDPLNMAAYKVKLFPNDAVAQDQFLHVNFPNKDQYILSNMWSVMGSSLLMLIMVGGIFYFSVNTMLSQKKLSNIKNDFINNMTHELKTPVSTIALALEVIKDKTISKTKESTNRYLNIIEEENKRLENQVEKVLQIAQLEKGDVKLKFETLDSNQVLNNVLKNLSVQLEKNHVDLEIDLAAIEYLISGDKVHLTNIFYNLIDNAIKYSHENPKIRIKTENLDNSLKISIIDEGIGIPKDQIAKIFDKFYRVPKGNLHDVKGYGLGLSYVRNMLKLHGGKIEVNSKIDEGSEFIVSLPLA